jgi:hypothetical protein
MAFGLTLPPSLLATADKAIKRSFRNAVNHRPGESPSGS